MIEVHVMYVPRDKHNTRKVGVLLIGQDGSVALSRYDRPTKLYRRGVMTEYERHNGWYRILEALRVGLKEEGAVVENTDIRTGIVNETEGLKEPEELKESERPRETEERNKITAQGRKARAKDKKAP